MNKEKIVQKIESINCKLGIYDAELDNLNKANIAKLLEGIECGSDTDVDININRKKYVVEIMYVDSEIDFVVRTKAEYIERYGSSRWEN